MRIGSAKQSYALDSALLDSRTQYVWLGATVLALCAFPFVANEYWLYLACLVAINIASTTGLNILTGYTGLVSLGQAAFMGLGGYTVAILQIRFGTPFMFNLLAGGVVAMLAGVLVGLPSLRVKGLYLAIATIAAGVIAHFIFSHFTVLTGGNSGLSVPAARFFGIELDNSFKLYWVIVPTAILMLLGALVGGIAVGLIEAWTGFYLGGEYKILATFSLLVLILLVRPYGLFGTHDIERL